MGGCGVNSNDINKTFILKPREVTGGTPTYSACTALYTDMVRSCSGDTTLMMSEGVSIFNADLEVNGDISGVTLSGATFLSGGTDLISIIDARDTYVTGASYNNLTNFLTLDRSDGGTISVNLSVSGGTTGNCINELYVTNVYGCSPITIHDVMIHKDDIVPDVDGFHSVGTPIKRFRELNALSGTTTLWTASTRVTTSEVDLGTDSQSNPRIITANNSIIQNDLLDGGSY